VKSYDELKKLIEQRGVHAQLGPVGEGWGIEQNPHELATFLIRMQELDVQSVLEIGTGYKAGLARFLAHEMGWKVTTVDIQDYGHRFDNIQFVIYLPDMPINFIETIDPPDLVFIDGAHDYESVRHDYETYSPLATKAVAFHDIFGMRDCQGARDFWIDLAFEPADQFMLKPDHYEVYDTSSALSGIGWIEL
jgi:hypothetical protein